MKFAVTAGVEEKVIFVLDPLFVENSVVNDVPEAFIPWKLRHSEITSVAARIDKFAWFIVEMVSVL